MEKIDTQKGQARAGKISLYRCVHANEFTFLIQLVNSEISHRFGK